MNTYLIHYFTKTRKVINALVPYGGKLILPSSIAVFLIAITANIMNSIYFKRKFKSLSKNQKRILMKSKLFFKGFGQKVKIELNGNEGIKYSKTQLFLDKIIKNAQKQKMMKQVKQNELNNQRHLNVKDKVKGNEAKPDKVFFCILNNYLNRKGE